MLTETGRVWEFVCVSLTVLVSGILSIVKAQIGEARHIDWTVCRSSCIQNKVCKSTNYNKSLDLTFGCDK